MENVALAIIAGVFALLNVVVPLLINKKKIEPLKAEKSDLKAQKSDLEQAFEDIKQTNEELKQKNYELEQTNVNLKDERDKFIKAAEKLKKEISEPQKALTEKIDEFKNQRQMIFKNLHRFLQDIVELYFTVYNEYQLSIKSNEKFYSRKNIINIYREGAKLATRHISATLKDLVKEEVSSCVKLIWDEANPIINHFTEYIQKESKYNHEVSKCITICRSSNENAAVRKDKDFNSATGKH